MTTKGPLRIVEVTLPDGRTMRKESRTHDYTHAVIGDSPYGWHVQRWSRDEIAALAARSAVRWPGHAVRVVTTVLVWSDRGCPWCSAREASHVPTRCIERFVVRRCADHGSPEECHDRGCRGHENFDRAAQREVA